MSHRRRQGSGSGPAAALGLGLLVLAAAALGGAWYFVKVRSDPAPQGSGDGEVGVGEFDAVVPWDRVTTEDSGEFTMILEAPPHWDLTQEEIAAFLKDVEACRNFASDGLEGFYPEAKGRVVRIRIECAKEPTAPIMDELRKIARRSGAYKYDLAVEAPDGTLRTRPIRKG